MEHLAALKKLKTLYRLVLKEKGVVIEHWQRLSEKGVEIPEVNKTRARLDGQWQRPGIVARSNGYLISI
jgi:hypothetical protein